MAGGVILLLTFLFSHTAMADTPQVKVMPTPDWVVVQSYDPNDLKGQPTGGPAYLLLSNQRRLEDKDSAYYGHRVMRVDDVSDAEDASQISLTFDPSYQWLAIHYIRVRRGDEVQDRYKADRLKVLQNETDADRLMYNGEVTASYILKDIRPGDIIDYAYTIHGKNPVYFGHIGTDVGLRYSVPIAHRYVRIMMPNDRPIRTRAYAGAAEPKVTVEGGQHVLTWDLHDVPTHSADDDEPVWYESYAGYEISDFRDWPSLGDHYTRYYHAPEKISPALQQVIDSIRTDHKTPVGQARAALRFVQASIRYLGMENGEGAYAPRDPSQVLDQRFGDCKDKTMLLVTILERLGIKALPALVDSRIRKHVRDRLPSAYAFDHVITRMELGGKVYWLDATKDDQIGNLDNLEQAPFEAGLVIDGKASRMETIPLQLADGRLNSDVTETFDLASDPKTVGLSVKTVMWGDSADTFLSRLKRKGAAEIQKGYMNYYAKDHSSIKVAAPMTVKKDVEKGIVTVEEHYSIPDGWDLDDTKKNKSFTAWPTEVRAAMPDVKGNNRTSPRAIGYPHAVRHELVFKLSGKWNMHPKNTDIKDTAFSFSKKESFQKNIYKQIYVFRRDKGSIPVSDIAKSHKDLDKMWDAASVSLSTPVSGATKLVSNKDDTGSLGSPRSWLPWLIVAIAAGFTLVITSRERR
ncbi:DUF3857 domain-containing transglutaminase family protein [Kordiimonas marina]|uniref:DUF3857 domain-containing transglutaminase family protein n=1 Tax=Kordiimonas marina TaxID=2872312 RepID=UPI001FF3B9B5|nr:DUF3857 domain-containing transglutaminase family protein [Kordiimonas marina]MCJ9429545.1 DUF3857 domain-containing transglutaminase family protein [Kordiimonas marina]